MLQNESTLKDIALLPATLFACLFVLFFSLLKLLWKDYVFQCSSRNLLSLWQPDLFLHVKKMPFKIDLGQFMMLVSPWLTIHVNGRNVVPSNATPSLDEFVFSCRLPFGQKHFLSTRQPILLSFSSMDEWMYASFPFYIKEGYFNMVVIPWEVISATKNFNNYITFGPFIYLSKI